MNANSATTETENKLKELSQFENFFHKSNLILGLRMWVKTTGIMWVVSFAAVLTGLLSILGNIALLLLIALNIFLFQWASVFEARRMYGMPVLGSCWWSIFWRLILYMIPVWVLLTFMMPEGYLSNPELVLEDPTPLLAANVILNILSILPMGMITTQAFLKSLLRIKLLKNTSFGKPPAESNHNKGDAENLPGDEDQKD